MVRGRRASFVVLFVLVTALSSGASAQLNPLVARAPQPNGYVPPECAEGTVVAESPRIDVGELRDLLEPPTVTAMPAPPPTASLRSALDDIATAAAREDRKRFDASLRQAKDILATYPSGGEKRAAQQKIDVYEDVAQLWRYQNDSPTGAFIAEGSDLHELLTRYPGYEDAVRRQVITDARGTKFYPTRESRAFLLRATGAPARATVTTPKAAEPRATEPRVAARPAPSHTAPSHTSPSRTTERAPASPTPRHAPAATQPRVSKPATSKPAVAKSRAETQVARATPLPVVTPARPHVETPAPAPTPAPISAPPVTATQPPPVQPATETATTTTQTASVDTAVTQSTTSSADATTATTDTTLSSAEATTTTTAAESPSAPKPRAGRNIIIPAILILVGLGVLIVLFRASS